MHRLARLVVGFAAALALAPSLAAQTVRGRVVEAESGEPVPGVRIEALTERGRASGGRTVTETDGSFLLPLRAAGAYTLRAQRISYPASTSPLLEVGLRDTVEVEIRVSSEPLRVDPVVVTAHRRPPELRSLRNAGFYERQREGFGRFMERAEIERYRSSTMVEILDRMPGTRRIGNLIVFPRSSSSGILQRTQRGGPTHCAPEYYIDGILVSIHPPQGLNDVVIPEHAEAIEVYSSPSNIPARYNGSNAACGVVLIWTRAEP